MTNTEIVRETVRRFPNLPNLTIAKMILHNYGDQFDGDLEKIRSAVRYSVGANGDKNRDNATELVEKTTIKMPETWRKTRTPYKLPVGRHLVMADLHIPFHEPKAIEATIKFAQTEGDITGILFNGDLFDYAAVSFWQSQRKRDFDRELELCVDFLDFLEQELPGLKKVFKPGNHEYRLPRLLASKAPELIGTPLAAFDTVFAFEFRNIEFLDYYQIVNAGKLPILHGHEYRTIQSAVNPARGLFLKAKSWAMCSHCHQTSEHSERDIRGTLMTTWSTGCLCDLSPDYAPYGNWNWGFAVVNVEKNGDFKVDNRRILPSGQVV